jgi:hypothetical protein
MTIARKRTKNGYFVRYQAQLFDPINLYKVIVKEQIWFFWEGSNLFANAVLPIE